MNELQITIQTQSGALTVTPLSLLQFYLPGAKPLPDNPQVYTAPKPGKPNEMQYVFVETLHGVLMTARDKHLNPVNEIYVIPSNSPTKKSGYKIKYDAALERLRNVPGFLGVNWGVIVQRDKEILDRAGEAAFPGDKVIGAWAECYINGLAKPLRNEVDLSVKGVSPNWDQRLNFMLCKVAVDHLTRLKVLPIYAKPENEGEELLLEAHVPEVVTPTSQQGQPQPESQTIKRPKPRRNAGELYIGTITQLVMPEGKTPGRITLKPDGEDTELTCYFREVPEELAIVLSTNEDGEIEWPEGCVVGLSFREVDDPKHKTKWRVLDTIDCSYPTKEDGKAHEEWMSAFEAEREAEKEAVKDAFAADRAGVRSTTEAA